MKVVFLCCVLLLAGSASASSVEAKSLNLPEWLPDNIPDWIVDLIENLPDSIQSIIDRLPEIIDAIPEILVRLEEIIELIIENAPIVIEQIIDKLPEILEQIPALVDNIREVLRTIIRKIPELIPTILEKIPLIIEAIPEAAALLKDIYDQIREILESYELPDWFPTLPDLEKPDWWPIDLPELPEYNAPTSGVRATAEDFPGIVQIEVGTSFIWAQGCAGSVLTSLHIMCSARCFDGRGYQPRFRRVRAGSSRRYTGGLVVGVENAIIHPDFEGSNGFDGDIAVVRLATSLLFSPTIQQASIVSQGFTIPTGLEVVVAGWGRTAQGGLVSDEDLYSKSLIVTDSDSCAQAWARVPLFQITSNMRCLRESAYPGRNGDIRDMGAPAYYQGIVVGVVSLGAPVGNSVLPVVTTSVGSYTNWVISNAV